MQRHQRRHYKYRRSGQRHRHKYNNMLNARDANEKNKNTNSNTREKRKDAILEARRLAMEDYSLFAQIAREVTRLHALPHPAERGTILSRRAARKAHPLASLPDIAHMALRKTAAYFRPAR